MMTDDRSPNDRPRSSLTRRTAMIGLPPLLLSTTAGASPSTAKTRMGVFSPAGGRPDSVVAYERRLGRRLKFVVDNAQQFGDWTAVTGGLDFLLRGFQGQRWDMVIGVPLLSSKAGTLAEGAVGRHDSYFKSMAANLVDKGYGHAIIRLGWEFNGRWQPWFAGADTASFIVYWRRVVGILRAASPNFRFSWCSTLGQKHVAQDQCYPGDAYVDIIDLDVYDEAYRVPRSDPDRWWREEYLDAKFGLRWQADFATKHRKTVAYSEWGLRPANQANGHGGGDNPVFIEKMADWLDGLGGLLSHHAYFERDDYGLMGGFNRRASAAFIRRFGA